MIINITDKIFEGKPTVGSVLLSMYFKIRAEYRYHSKELKLEYLHYILDNKKDIEDFLFEVSGFSNKYDLNVSLDSDKLNKIFNKFEQRYGL